jgi:transcriptional regulator with XRE-family HTH domain
VKSKITLADAVRHLRLRKGLSTRALSQSAGLSPSYVSKLEAGEIEPSVRAFGKLAVVLGMNQHEIFFCVVTEGLEDAMKMSHPPIKVNE